MLIYLHIPKTAGTTMMAILKQNYGTGFHRIDNEGKRLKWIKLPEDERAAVTCLTGHITYGIHEYIPGFFQYVTMLRDPVERILSLYYYVREKNHVLAPLLSQITLKEFVEKQVISDTNDGMVRFLAGKSEFGQIKPASGKMTIDDLETAMSNLTTFTQIGFVETFNESLRKFTQEFNWNYNHYVSMLINTGRPVASDLPRRVIQCLTEYNQLDYELYRFGKKLMGEVT